MWKKGKMVEMAGVANIYYHLCTACLFNSSATSKVITNVTAALVKQKVESFITVIFFSKMTAM